MKKSEIYNPELASLRWRNDITIMQTCHIMQKYERDLRIILLKLYTEKIKFKV